MSESLPSRAFERAYAWLASPVDSLAICMSRALLGATLVAAYLQYLPFAHTFFGPHGIGGYDTLERHPHFTGMAFEWYTQIRVLHLLSAEWAMWSLYAVLLLSSTAFAIGMRPRITGAIAALLHMIFYAHNPMLDGGWGSLMGPFVLYVVLCDCGAQLSFDAWWQRRRGGDVAPRRIEPWGMRLLQVHVCVQYLWPGFDRLDAPGWVQGEMVLRELLNSEYGRFELDWMVLAPVLKVITLAVLVIEPAAPFILWMRFVGRYWALALIGMHLGMELLLDTGWWQPMMIAALLPFLPARWLRRVLPARRVHQPRTGDQIPSTARPRATTNAS